MTKGFVVSPKLEQTTFTKIMKVLDFCLSSQQLVIESRITGFGIGQLAGKKTKGVPIVSRFLLHDPSEMGIKGISGKRKFSCWGGMLEWHRRC